MKTSEAGIRLIKNFEGTRFRPYLCAAKVWTIGVGHVLYPRQLRMPIENRTGIKLLPSDQRTFTEDEVNALLRADLEFFESGVHRLCRGSLTQFQFDALVSFAFNCGLGTLQRSTLRRKVLRKDYIGAADEFLKFCRAGGRILPGLQRRRIAERALFLKQVKDPEQE
jgi:lysozyme